MTYDRYNAISLLRPTSHGRSLPQQTEHDIMAIKKYGTAQWTGGLKDGKGNVSTESGALSKQPYGFNTRFEATPGTNPEELIGAAHAACFAMALSGVLGSKNITADLLETKSTVTLEKKDDGFAVTAVHLDLHATVQDIDFAAFSELANTAKAGCPISKLLNAPITLEVVLEQ